MTEPDDALICAECGHLHFFGAERGYSLCPIDECACEGQGWAKGIAPFPQVGPYAKKLPRGIIPRADARCVIIDDIHS